MKITIEHEGHKAIVEDETIVDICEAIDLLEHALIKIGYDSERLQGAFIVKARQISADWNKPEFNF
ncbi:MAG: hypothetical protein KBD53_01955 [Candidatus Omnitrophica bacterium]|nr:hypothetical protein [Candidatus Omnitrophota bacterium]